VAGYHHGAGQVGKVGRQVLSDGIGQVVILFVAAQVGEWQNHQREPRRFGNAEVRHRHWRRRCIQSSDSHHKCLYWPADVLQCQRAKLLEAKAEPFVHVIMYRPRNTDTSWWTFRLQSRHNIHRVAMQVSAIGDCVSDVDPHSEADRAITRLIAIMDGHLRLNLDRTSNSSVDAVEHDQQ
jgi:hypothetical protein